MKNTKPIKNTMPAIKPVKNIMPPPLIRVAVVLGALAVLVGLLILLSYAQAQILSHEVT